MSFALQSDRLDVALNCVRTGSGSDRIRWPDSSTWSRRYRSGFWHTRCSDKKRWQVTAFQI